MLRRSAPGGDSGFNALRGMGRSQDRLMGLLGPEACLASCRVKERNRAGQKRMLGQKETDSRSEMQKTIRKMGLRILETEFELI
jgi:hypothetical protein